MDFGSSPFLPSVILRLLPSRRGAHPGVVRRRHKYWLPSGRRGSCGILRLAAVSQAGRLAGNVLGL